MKREDLLDAIGNVDESLLEECETVTLRRSPILWKAVIVAAAMALMSVTALAAVKLLSRPVKDGGVSVGTVAPFEVDLGGNIVMGPVAGWQVTMDVEFDEDAPETLELVYRMLPSARWEYQYDSVRNDDLLEDRENKTVWTHMDRPGQLRFYQSVSGYYGLEGERVVDALHGLPLDTKLKTEIVTIANRQVLKLTVPAVKIDGMLDQNAMYCEEGEIRLYWTDGQYLLQLDYPIWVPEKEVEAMLDSLFTVQHTEVYPEHWGKIDPERIKALEPGLTLEEDKTGTTQVNNTMTVGMLANEDGVLYLSASGGILKYDTASGKTAFLETEENSLPRNLFLTEHYICYSDYLFNRHGLYILAKDGTGKDYVYEGISIDDLSVVGSALYGVEGQKLKRIDLETGEIVTVADQVNRYFVDEDHIYILPCKGNFFLKGSREDLVFEKTELSFQPISMVKNGDDLYFTVGGELEEGQVRYQVVRYSDGMEAKLPVNSLRMQFLDGKLIYANDADSSTVWCYDPVTGESKLLQENVFDFYVCGDGTVVYHYLYAEGWGIWDPKTDELTLVKGDPE